MDKTYRVEFYRLFVLDRLPASISPSDAHLQIYDNYVAGTRLRFRRTRVPGSREWKRVLQQRIGGSGHFSVAEMVLDDAEYRALGAFEGNEIRKNRYFAEIGDVACAFDSFLGALTGLVTARADFESAADAEAFDPPFGGIEVTAEPFFDGANLYAFGYSDAELALSRLAGRAHSRNTVIGEIASDYE